jgi:sugar phosphate isomerase/epimerase
MGARGVRVGTAGYDGKTPYDRVLAGTLKGWRAVAKLARRHGVKALLEIHMGTIVPSASAARRLAGAFDPREVGVIHDAGNMVYEGFENWQMGMEILGPYLAHVHVKNGSWAIRAGDPDGNLRWRCDADSLRHGAVSWADVILALRRVGYDGWLSLEDFSAGATDEKLRDDVAYLRALLAAAGEKV